MQKKVIYLSYDGMTDALGQSQVIPYLKGLAGAGHQIMIVSAEKKDHFEKIGKEIALIFKAAGIGWNPVPYSNAIPVYSQRMNYRRLLIESLRLQKEHQFDIVHCRSYIPSLIGLQLKRRLGVKFIFDMRGFWADERVEGGIWSLQNPLYKYAYHYFKRKEKEFLQESDAIVSLTENAKEEILSWNEIRIIPEKISVIPCCTDLDFFSPSTIDSEKKTALKKELGIAEADFILSYSGSIGTWYLLDEMLQFFKMLLIEKPSSKLLFITPEPVQTIFTAASQFQIDHSRLIIRAASRNEMPLFLSLSNASIFLIRNTFSKKASSPTKMGELMSMGIPVICNSGIGDVDRVINKTRSGIVLKELNEEQYKIGVKKLLETTFPAQELRKGAENFFSLQQGIQDYQKIYFMAFASQRDEGGDEEFTDFEIYD